MTPVGRVTPRRPWLGFVRCFSRILATAGGSAPRTRRSDPTSEPRASHRTGSGPSAGISSDPTTRAPCAPGRITVPSIENLRLIGLNRNKQTCDLNRWGGFYRFSGSSLGQNAPAYPARPASSTEASRAKTAKSDAPQNRRAIRGPREAVASTGIRKGQRRRPISRPFHAEGAAAPTAGWGRAVRGRGNSTNGFPSFRLK